MISLRKTTVAGLAAAILATSAAMSSVSPALARSAEEITGQETASLPNYDGVYTVHISTRAGDCSQDYRWTILVSGGHVSATGDTPMEASGRINSNGAVSLQFRRFGQIAKVTGHVAKGIGSGTWSSPTMQCSGSWQAARRGVAAQ